MVQFDKLPPETIRIENRLRPLNEGAVDDLVKSIQRIGLQTPITVRLADEENPDYAATLVAGAHRLEALKRIGWEFVPVAIHDGTSDEARMWEIAENLHRAELTALERDEHVTEWLNLAERVSAQDVSKPGRPEGGVRQAAREIGINREDARRAKIVAGLTPEAKDAARAAGLDDNRNALLTAAKHPADAQAEAIRTYEPAPRVKPAPVPLNDFETEEVWMTAMMRVWNRGAADWRERFIASVDQPVFDRT